MNKCEIQNIRLQAIEAERMMATAGDAGERERWRRRLEFLERELDEIEYKRNVIHSFRPRREK